MDESQGGSKGALGPAEPFGEPGRSEVQITADSIQPEAGIVGVIQIKDDKGTVRVCRADGRIEFLLPTTGPQLLASAPDAGGPSPVEFVEVRSGRWSLAHSRRNLLRDFDQATTRIILDGRVAKPVELVRPDGADRVVLIAAWPDSIPLRVIDADTGADVDRVDVVFSGTGRSGQEWADFGHHLQTIALVPPPSPGGIVLAQMASTPLALQSRSVPGIYWVGAPGYAWAKWFPAGLDPEENVVELMKSARIDAILDHAAFPEHQDLTVGLYFADVRRRGGATIEGKPDMEGRVVFDRIPPGSFLIRAKGTGTFAEEHVELEAGAQRTVVLTNLARLEPGELEVWIIYPQGALRPTAGEESVLVEPASEYLSVAGVHRFKESGLYPDALDDGRLIYVIGPMELTPGDYWISVGSTSQSIRATVPPGPSVALIELSERGPVLVTAFDELTGEPVTLQSCIWRCVARQDNAENPLAGVAQPSMHSSNPRPETPLILELAPGWIDFFVIAKGYGISSHQIHLEQGVEHIDLKLRARVRVFLDIDSPAGMRTADSRWLSRVKVRAADGSTIPLTTFGSASRGSSTRGFIAFQGAGRCTIIGGWFDGVGWILPADLQVEPGLDYNLTLGPAQ